jgi:hypothetical protein
MKRTLGRLVKCGSAETIGSFPGNALVVDPAHGLRPGPKADEAKTAAVSQTTRLNASKSTKQP